MSNSQTTKKILGLLGVAILVGCKMFSGTEKHKKAANSSFRSEYGDYLKGQKK